MAKGSEQQTGGLCGTTNKGNSIVSSLHKPKGYVQGLLIKAE
jgi:hypothetical protein